MVSPVSGTANGVFRGSLNACPFRLLVEGRCVYSGAMNLLPRSCGPRVGVGCVWITLAIISVAQGQDASLLGSGSRAAAVLDSMPHAKKIDQVALSPDGGQVAYVVDGGIKLRDLGIGGVQTRAVEG